MDRDAVCVLKLGIEELILGGMVVAVGWNNIVRELDGLLLLLLLCSYSHCSSPMGKRR